METTEKARRQITGNLDTTQPEIVPGEHFCFDMDQGKSPKQLRMGPLTMDDFLVSYLPFLKYDPVRDILYILDMVEISRGDLLAEKVKELYDATVDAHRMVAFAEMPFYKG